MPSTRRTALPVLLLATTLCGASAVAAELRLERVRLSSAGVALLEHAAEIGPQAELELVVPADRVDDILKSLTVFDPAGTSAAVTLSGEGPLADPFRDLPFGERELTSPAALLAALRGTPVVIGGPVTVAGRILAIVPEEEVRGEARLVRHRLTLATADGLRSVLLEDVHTVQLAEPAVAAALERALGRLAETRASAERRLGVRLEGSTDRRVRVAWVEQAPIWKMSYRAVLGPTALRLQGWAVVDNRSGRDWEEVELTLVSGAPVTLRQALSKLVWAERPEVPVRLPDAIRPRPDEGVLPPGRAGATTRGAPQPASAAPLARAAPEALFAEELAGPAGIEEAAAAEAATRTLFRLPHPVSVRHGATALLPVLDRVLPAERILLVQADRVPLRALLALRLVNEEETTLPPGILTVLELDAEGRPDFLGDAELARLPPGESRLVPVAVDPRTRVSAESRGPAPLVSIKAADGLLVVDRVERRSVRYRIETPSGEPRTLVLEHPHEPGFRLVAPAPTGESPGFWRFERRLEPGTVLELELVLERPERREFALLDLDPQALRVIVEGTELPAAVERALAELSRLRAALTDAEVAVERLRRERAELEAEQARLRANLAAVPAGSDAAARYLAGLVRSEDRLEALGVEVARAREAAEAAAARLRRFVRELVL